MDYIISILMGLGAVVVLFLMMRGQSIGEDVVIDSNDARQIGNLIGLSGGSIPDAAVAQSALRRFEEIHGRKATMKEVGIVVGMIKAE